MDILTILVEKEGSSLLIIKSFQVFFSLLVALMKLFKLVIHQLLNFQLVLDKGTETSKKFE